MLKVLWTKSLFVYEIKNISNERKKPEMKPVLINKAGQWNLLQEFNNYIWADILWNIWLVLDFVQAQLSLVHNRSVVVERQQKVVTKEKEKLVAFKRMLGI